MIIENVVKGSLETTLHSFTFATEEMNLIMSAGSYVQMMAMKITESDSTIIPIAVLNEDTHYEVWLTTSGLTILTRTDTTEFGVVVEPIDKLAWFTVTAGTSLLDGVEINSIRMEAIQ